MVNKKFIPTQKQIDLLRVMIDGEGKPTITAFCEEAGIDRKSYYNWFDNYEFVEWFNREWELAMAKKVTWLDKVGLMKSPTDFRYWEALQMKYGKFSRKEDIKNTVVSVDDFISKLEDADAPYEEKTNNTVPNKDEGTGEATVPTEPSPEGPTE